MTNTNTARPSLSILGVAGNPASRGRLRYSHYNVTHDSTGEVLFTCGDFFEAKDWAYAHVATWAP